MEQKSKKIRLRQDYIKKIWDIYIINENNNFINSDITRRRPFFILFSVLFDNNDENKANYVN